MSMTAPTIVLELRAAFDECRAVLDIPTPPSAPALPAWYGRRPDMALALTGVGLRCLAAYLGNLNPHNHRGD